MPQRSHAYQHWAWHTHSCTHTHADTHTHTHKIHFGYQKTSGFNHYREKQRRGCGIFGETLPINMRVRVSLQHISMSFKVLPLWNVAVKHTHTSMNVNVCTGTERSVQITAVISLSFTTSRAVKWNPPTLSLHICFICVTSFLVNRNRFVLMAVILQQLC